MQSKRRARAKGQEFERLCVNTAKAKGLDAERIKGSGAQAAGHKDITIKGLTGECKWRADGFKQIYDWLDGGHFLAIKANRKQPLVVLPLEAFTDLLKGVSE